MRRLGGIAMILLCLHQAGSSSEPTIVYRGSGGGGIEAGQGVKLESFDPARGFWSVTLAESGEDGGSVDFKMLDVDVGKVGFLAESHHAQCVFSTRSSTITLLHYVRCECLDLDVHFS
jgi:hypothetical protein